jgi:hypothetical protein
MKKHVFVFVLLALALIATGVKADVATNNPNGFYTQLNCGGQVVFAYVNVPSSNGGHVIEGPGKTAHLRTMYIDFNFDGVFTPDELVYKGDYGIGYNTIFCTFTWDRDPYLHGVDAHFTPK